MIMAVTAVPTVSVSGEAFVEGDLEFEINDCGETLTVIYYYGNAAEVAIPHEMRGMAVTHIGDMAFAARNLTSVTIPDSVVYVGEAAFAWSGLTSVVIPDSVTHIGDWAFEGTNLTSVTISNSVTRIGTRVFEGTNLTSVVIPDSVTHIGWAAFAETNLTSVVIPDSVTHIEWGAFLETPWLDSQPDGMVYAGRFAYVWKGDIPENTTVILASDTIGIVDAAFEGTNLSSVVIPDGVTHIGREAFVNTNLTSVVIPESVTHIGQSAFGAIPRLTTVTFRSSVPPNFDNGVGVITNSTNIRTICVPIGSREAYRAVLDNIFWINEVCGTCSDCYPTIPHNCDCCELCGLCGTCVTCDPPVVGCGDCGDCADCDPTIPHQCDCCEVCGLCGTCVTCDPPVVSDCDDCKNCSDCGHIGGRFGFGRVRGGDNARPQVNDALQILRCLGRAAESS
jgi:hypothetical protein